MAEKTFWESFKAEGTNVMERIRTLVKAGNVRRVVITHDRRTVAEFPLTAGVVGVFLAPVLAAVGAVIALLKECTIHVEVDRSVATGASAPTSAERAPLDVEC